MVNFSKTTNCKLFQPNYTRNHVITYRSRIISEKLVRKMRSFRVSKFPYSDQTCHIEKENKFGMVRDMMFICTLVDYDIHVHSRSIPK